MQLIKGAWIVVKSLKDGNFEFKNHPYVHRSFHKAIAEADRLAHKYPGHRFFVFTMTGKSDKYSVELSLEQANETHQKETKVA